MNADNLESTHQSSSAEQRKHSNKFSCFMIGSESHLIRCGEILLQRGHHVYGIISGETPIANWAREMGIPLLEPGPSLASVLSRQPFDYLFSVVYPELIPAEILALPRKHAINFHDGPLPRYAGLNATSWAIINREKVHGITWHIMSETLDTGDILKRRTVDIADGDTALMLNAKCYEACVDAFSELVDELASGSAQPSQQDLSRRSYYSKYLRPPAACALFWNQPADRIASLVRALDFGTYANPLGLPKLIVGNEIVIAPEIEIVDEASGSIPGTVVAVTERSLRLATASNDVVLGHLRSVGGQILSVADWLARHQLRVGDHLDDLDDRTARRLTILDGSVCRHEMFWVRRLAAADPLAVSTSNSRQVRSGFVASEPVSMTIPIESDRILAAFEDTADRGDIMAAFFCVFLARLRGRYAFDIGFSYPALRQRIEGFEGFFASNVPLHVEFDPLVSFCSALEMVQADLELVRLRETYALDAFLRYPQLRLWSAANGAPQLPVTIVLGECPKDHPALLGRELVIILSEDGHECHWLYDCAFLEQRDILRMQQQLGAFVQRILADNDRPVALTAVIPEDEHRRTIVEWNNTKAEYPLDLCLHELFEAQVERTPDAIAVSFEGQDLTYRTLNRRANQLAHHLQRLGVGPEVLVGVFMERSLEMVISLYGILKAGGAYVPLDPEYPPDRIAFMLEDTQVPVLLTQERLAASLPEHRAKVICVDSEWETIAQGGGDNPVSGATAGNLAYVIYTSGSTGRPKGVMNTHRGICNRLLWMQDQYRLTEADRVLQKTPFSFDVSVWEFFWPLLVGARLVIARPGGHKDSGYLVRLIVEQGITTLHFVPSMLQVFLEEKGVETCHSLQRVICSGEALPYALQERFFERLAAELHNLYGPTEAAVDVSYWQCQRDSMLRTVPIGRPVANTQLYILDRYMQPVPIGVAGELHIGGVQVARGYLNRPELTAEKFIPDPFSDDPQARLYKTGDLARYLPDGNIEFLGRLDHQVKLRGNRIELGEIESVLAQHPAVREAVVTVCEDVPGDKRLVAYVVPHRRLPLDIGELRDFLRQKLPEYMVPAAFVQLEALPLTANGKVDRRSLPPPERERQPEEKYIAPQNELERLIAAIWRELLQVETVGAGDNFFDLGGHSLLLMQAHSRLRAAIGKELSVIDLFRFPTVRSLAQHLSQDSDNGEQTTRQESADRAAVRREALLRRRECRRVPGVEAAHESS